MFSSTYFSIHLREIDWYSYTKHQIRDFTKCVQHPQFDIHIKLCPLPITFRTTLLFTNTGLLVLFVWSNSLRVFLTFVQTEGAQFPHNRMFLLQSEEQKDVLLIPLWFLAAFFRFTGKLSGNWQVHELLRLILPAGINGFFFFLNEALSIIFIFIFLSFYYLKTKQHWLAWSFDWWWCFIQSDEDSWSSDRDGVGPEKGSGMLFRRCCLMGASMWLSSK